MSYRSFGYPSAQHRPCSNCPSAALASQQCPHAASAHRRPQARFELPVLGLQRVDERLVLRDVLLHGARVAPDVRLDFLGLQAGRDGCKGMYSAAMVCPWRLGEPDTSGWLGRSRACKLKIGERLTAGNNICCPGAMEAGTACRYASAGRLSISQQAVQQLPLKWVVFSWACRQAGVADTRYPKGTLSAGRSLTAMEAPGSVGSQRRGALLWATRH